MIGRSSHRMEIIMDCIVIAGCNPDTNDSLYEYTKGERKALLNMNGCTMLVRVLNALQSARHVDDVILVGLGADSGQRFLRPVIHVADQGSLVGNVLAGVNRIITHKPNTRVVLISSSDIPLLTGEIVDSYIEMCHPFDCGVYYNVVTKETMEARFPDSNRTFIRLKDAEVTGGDIHIIQTKCISGNRELWDKLVSNRKQPWKFASTVGWGVLFKLFMHQLLLADIEKLIQKKINHKAKIVLSPHAELAMDGDRPHHIEMLRNEIAQLER